MSYPYVNPIFQPAMRLLANLAQGNPTVFETTPNHLYKTGLIVRILIPYNCTPTAANNFVGPITVTGPNTFTMDIDSTNFESLSTPIAPVELHAYPSVVPVGEINAQLYQSTHNIYGS
jgi:hypothetical protein